MKIGIFGGSFNPPHLGHVNNVTTITKKLGLDKVHIIPANQSPLKIPVEGPTAEQRLEMTKRAFATYGDKFIVDDRELRRGGTSYTIDTVREFTKQHSKDELFLILGADKFEELSDWKDYTHLLEIANIVVASRPGYEWPEEIDSLPAYLKPMVAEHDFNFIELKSGRSIQFLTLEDIEISSTELRKKIRIGKPVEKYLPLAVESYIRSEKIYRSLGEKISNYKEFTEFCGTKLFEKKGINVRGFDLTKMTSPSEYTIVASGTSTRHAVSLAENVIAAVKEEYNIHPQSLEGVDEGRWVVIDYGSLIVHIFYDFVRQEYSLESLWKEARDLNLKDPFLGSAQV